MIMKKLTAILLSVMMLLACVVTASADDAGYLGVMLGTNVMSLDTNLATDGDSFEVIADCIDGLTQMDAEGSAIPALAESWDVSPDGLTYTFTLRPDNTFAFCKYLRHSWHILGYRLTYRL